MPYSSSDRAPLHHELFDKFLSYNPNKDPPFEPQETLKAWQKKNHPWLELSDVHKETTEGVRVTVIPFYMGCRETPAASVYWVYKDIRAAVLALIDFSFTILVAILYSIGKFGRIKRSTARTPLENILFIRDLGDCKRSGSCWARACFES